jgi:hypothetical protein
MNFNYTEDILNFMKGREKDKYKWPLSAGINKNAQPRPRGPDIFSFLKVYLTKILECPRNSDISLKIAQ